MEPNFKADGPGRLATPAHQFHKHWKTGEEFRHIANQIDLSPTVSIGATIANDVQEAIELLAAKGDLIVVGDGYDTYKNILTDPNNPYDASVPEFGAYLNSLLNDSTTEIYTKLKKSGLVIIKNGTYKVSTTINVPPGISIIGEGYGTKLVNITANQSVFTIKSDPDRIADLAIDSTSPFIFSKRTYLVNLTIGDNFIEPRYTGDTGYKTPLNTSSTSSLITQEPGSNLICDNVYLMGKQTFSGPTLTSCSSIAIKTDSSLPVSTGTQLTLQHSALDGFSQAVDFTVTSATINTTKYDYLVIQNNKIRVDGYLGSDTVSSNYANNTFFKMKACNALITNNYLYGSDSGYIDCVTYVTQFPASLPLDGYGRITICDNWGAINKASSSFGTTGNILRFNGTPSFVFSTVSNNNFDNSSLEWADQNTILSGSNLGIVKFSGTNSSTGDGVLRTFDGYTISTNILRVLNARPTVSVGDGVDSFGDFNGVIGINSAITLIGANSSSGKILLKRGTFNFSSLNTVSISGKVIEMEGVGGDGERPGTSFISSDNSTMLTLTSSSTLKLKEIYFSVGATNGRSVNSTESSLWIENCALHDGYIQLNNCPPELLPANSNNTYSRFGLYCDKVKFNSSTNTAVDIRGGNVLNQYGFFFKDCEWQLRGYSGVRIGAINGESATEMSGIWFTGCNFNLTGSGATSNDWTTNPGIVELTTNNTASPGSHAPALTINDIHFSNCDGYGSSCIIHYIPTDNASIYTNTPGFGYVRTKLFDMNNCNWRLTPADLTFNPFVVALDARGSGTKISIKNTILGFTDAGASTNGSQTDDSTFWFPTLAVDQWAFATLTADEVELDNIKLINFNQSSDSGELLIESRKLNINNVLINGYSSTAAGSVPNGRVFINGGGLVNNLQVFGTTIASATDWADSGGNDYGIVLVKSDTYNMDGFTTRGSFPLNINNINIDDFIYNTSVGTRVGLRVSSVNISSTIDIKDINISNGRFFNVTNAIKYNSNASTNQKITSLKISGCNMITDGYGIFIDNSGASTSAPLGIIQINNCTIDATTTGAYIKSQYFGTDSFIQITNNYFKAPNLTAQVDIFDSTNSTMAEIRGVIMGNVTMIPGDVGIIRLRGTSNTADATYTMAAMPIVGCEVGYNTPSDRYILNGNRMFHNHAKLRTNNTLS